MSHLWQPKEGTRTPTNGWPSTSYNIARMDFRFRFISSMERTQKRWGSGGPVTLYTLFKTKDPENHTLFCDLSPFTPNEEVHHPSRVLDKPTILIVSWNITVIRIVYNSHTSSPAESAWVVSIRSLNWDKSHFCGNWEKHFPDHPVDSTNNLKTFKD